MARKTSASLRVDPNVRCLRVYPTEQTKKSVSELKTVGMRLDKEQAIHLARVLLAVTQEWEEVDITAYRLEERIRDHTYHITVTSNQNA